MNQKRSSRLLTRIDQPSDQPLHVVGLGHFGGNLALIDYLCRKGHSIVLWESASAETLKASWQKLAEHHASITVHWEENKPSLPSDDWVFVTPAIPWQHESLARVPNDYLSTEIELSLTLAHQNNIVVHTVLGSVGKSTCTALIQQALKIPMVGNIGCSLLSLLDQGPSEVVVEISSFQLHYLKPTAWTPASFILTPVDDHHADWHGSLKEYQRAKLDWVERWAKQGVPNVQFRDLSFAPNFFKDRQANLIGQHNLHNLQAVITWLETIHRKTEESVQACLDFKGLPHRLELCYDSHDLKCYNDSKATSPNATIEALQSFPKIELLILQGNLKELDYQKLLNMAEKNCREIWLVGGMAKLQRNNMKTFANLEEAFKEGTLPSSGNIVFSPAAPSYGDYKNYEERGDHFKIIINHTLAFRK